MPPVKRPVPGPIHPDAQTVLDGLAAFEATAIRAAARLREFGCWDLADALCGEIGHMQQISRTAARRLPGAVRPVQEHQA